MHIFLVGGTHLRRVGIAIFSWEIMTLKGVGRPVQMASRHALNGINMETLGIGKILMDELAK